MGSLFYVKSIITWIIFCFGLLFWIPFLFSMVFGVIAFFLFFWNETIKNFFLDIALLPWALFEAHAPSWIPDGFGIFCIFCACLLPLMSSLNIGGDWGRDDGGGDGGG